MARRKTLEEKQAEMLARHTPVTRPDQVAENSVDIIAPGTLPNEQQVLRALWRRAQSGKQGSTQAYKTYLEYLVGKAHQKPQTQDKLQLSAETTNRLIALAEKLTAHWPEKKLAAPLSGAGE